VKESTKTQRKQATRKQGYSHFRKSTLATGAVRLFTASAEPSPQPRDQRARDLGPPESARRAGIPGTSGAEDPSRDPRAIMPAPGAGCYHASTGRRDPRASPAETFHPAPRAGIPAPWTSRRGQGAGRQRAESAGRGAGGLPPRATKYYV